MQLFMSRYDLGAAADKLRPIERAVSLLDTMTDALTKRGLTVRPSTAEELAITAGDASFLCFVGANPGNQQYVLGCVFLLGDSPWLLTTELYGYHRADEAGFLRDASIAAQAAVRHIGDWTR